MINETSEAKARVQEWIVRDDENMMSDLMNGPLLGGRVIERCRYGSRLWRSCTHGEATHAEWTYLVGSKREFMKIIILAHIPTSSS